MKEMEFLTMDEPQKLNLRVGDLISLIEFMIEMRSQMVAVFYIEVLEEYYKSVLDKNIDNFLEMSIESETPEVTAFLLDYKNKHNLYSEPDWRL